MAMCTGGLASTAWLLLLLVFPAAHAATEQVGPSSDPPGQLILAQVVFRHGARTPLSNLYWPDTKWHNCNLPRPGSVNISLYDATGAAKPPNITDVDSAPVLPGGCRMGRLTNNGYNMAVELGRRLRQRYVQQHQLLPAAYSAASLLAQTTAFERTVFTLQGVLSGLYPGTAAVVPVACRTPEDEIMIGNNSTCAALPRLTDAFQAQQDATAAQDPRMQRLVAKLRSTLQLPATTPFAWGKLRDAIACMAAEGKALPRAALELLPTIDSIATQLKVEVAAPTASSCLGTKSQCEQVVRLTIGLFLNDILQHMDAAAAAVDAAVPAVPAASAQAVAQAQAKAAGQEKLQRQFESRPWLWPRRSRSHPQHRLPGQSKQQHHRQLHLGNTSKQAAGGSSQRRRPLVNFSSLDAPTPAAAATAAAVFAAAPAAAGGGARAARPAAVGKKLILYSAHDTSLMPLLSALGQRQRHWPNFTSHIAFELWQHGNGHYVQILHDGKPLQLRPAEILPEQHPGAASSRRGSSSSSGSSGVQARGVLQTGAGQGGSVAAHAVDSSAAENSQWVRLVDFKRHVVHRYVLSRRAHGRACG